MNDVNPELMGLLQQLQRDVYLLSHRLADVSVQQKDSDTILQNTRLVSLEALARLSARIDVLNQNLAILESALKTVKTLVTNSADNELALLEKMTKISTELTALRKATPNLTFTPPPSKDD